MEIALIILGIFSAACLVYFNTVATVIIFKAPDSLASLNIIRSVFVWLIPVIGFTFSLRFTQQSFECELHEKLVPRIMWNWIYDESLEQANPNADRKYNTAVIRGLAEMANQWRQKH